MIVINDEMWLCELHPGEQKLFSFFLSKKFTQLISPENFSPVPVTAFLSSKLNDFTRQTFPS
jgi:hypothetical protein